MPSKRFTARLTRKPSDTRSMSASKPTKRTKGKVVKNSIVASTPRKRTKPPTRTTGTGRPRKKGSY